MSEELRELLYPLGFLAAFAFGGRVIIQWVTSEIKQKSVVTPLFWWFSLAGNLLLLIHAWIQMQYHVCVVQSCNCVISWRNLNLMGPREQQMQFATVVKVLVASVLLTTALFALRGGDWFRIPVTSWQSEAASLSFTWHLVGFVGVILFSSRFWVQWILAEKHRTSYLGKPFWWLSLIGCITMLSYFLQISDPVNSIGPLLGLIPYTRNLILLQKNPVTLQDEKI